MRNKRRTRRLRITVISITLASSMSFIMYRSLSSSSSSLKTHRDDVSPLERSIADVVRDLKATRERVLRDVLATAVSTDTTDAREVENSSPIADALDQAKRIIENFDRAGRSNAREDEAESLETLRSVVESVSDVQRLAANPNSPVVRRAKKRSELFNRIHDANLWGSAESRSGGGSTKATTSTAARCIGEWIRKYDIKTFLDLPCGDANWQAGIPGIENVRYTGMDISVGALETAKTRMSEVQTDIDDFRTHDIVALPMRQRYDAIMHRDVVQHLSYEEALRGLSNFAKSGSTYFIVSTHPKSTERGVESDVGVARDIGYTYQNNMQSEPFNFPPPLEMCDNYANNDASKIAIWRIADLPNFERKLADISTHETGARKI